MLLCHPAGGLIMDKLASNTDDIEFKEVLAIIMLRRTRASQVVNNEVLLSAWEVGAFVSERLKTEAWGAKTVAALSEYLHTQNPGLRGYSRRNIYNMVMFYDAYSSSDFNTYAEKLGLNSLKRPIVQLSTAQLSGDNTARLPTGQSDKVEIVQSITAQMPSFLGLTTFTNHVEILNHCKAIEERIFYVMYACKERLNAKELGRSIKTETYASLATDGKSLSKGMKEAYPLSPVLFKDELFLDFLDLPRRHSERKLKSSILDHMKDFILEIGKDFLFIDSEYPLNVSGSTFKVDMLFFHRGLQCLVAMELKKGKFQPKDLGQLEFYLEALDRDVKRSNENPSIGILLCQNANQTIVEYAMSRSMSPTMISEYNRLFIPKEKLQKSLEEFREFFETGISGVGDKA
jgi:predicted nuclease of restriction endonuclease-like (RecB) superfamily